MRLRVAMLLGRRQIARRRGEHPCSWCCHGEARRGEMAAGKETTARQRETVIELVANGATRPLRDNDEDGSRGWRPWSCARCRRPHTTASFLLLTFSFDFFPRPLLPWE
ncbi:hypothetical protein SESBI_18565 [Sesbania bispinosa]|nr:hypothetical protein SESBI_18565 [Sesbania bispinosa]